MVTTVYLYIIYQALFRDHCYQKGELELLGFEFRSNSQQKTVKLRQEAVAEFVEGRAAVTALVC